MYSTRRGVTIVLRKYSILGGLTSRVAFGELWHHRSVIVFVQIFLRLLADLAGLVVLSVRRRPSVEADPLPPPRTCAVPRARHQATACRRGDASIACVAFQAV